MTDAAFSFVISEHRTFIFNVFWPLDMMTNRTLLGTHEPTSGGEEVSAARCERCGKERTSDVNQKSLAV